MTAIRLRVLDCLNFSSSFFSNYALNFEQQNSHDTWHRSNSHWTDLKMLKFSKQLFKIKFKLKIVTFVT